MKGPEELNAFGEVEYKSHPRNPRSLILCKLVHLEQGVVRRPSEEGPPQAGREEACCMYNDYLGDPVGACIRIDRP